MAIVIIDENSETGKNLLDIIRSHEKNGNDAVQICNDPELEEILLNRETMHEPMAEYHTANMAGEIPFERIPGLPYTHEERMASLRRAEEQRRLGLSISSDELEEEMKQW